MNSAELPQTLTYEGRQYCLNIEEMGSESVTMIYEQDPLNEESFLLGCCGTTIDAATKKMQELLVNL